MVSLDFHHPRFAAHRDQFEAAFDVAFGGLRDFVFGWSRTQQGADTLFQFGFIAVVHGMDVGLDVSQSGGIGPKNDRCASRFLRIARRYSIGRLFLIRLQWPQSS